MANFGRSLLTTLVIYRQCQSNHYCEQFTVTNNSANLLLCNTCGCHRDAHRREETIIVSPQMNYHLRNFIATAPPQLNPRNEADNGVVIQSLPSARIPRIRVEGSRLTLAQMGQMRELADGIGWNIGAFDGRAFRADLERIGITARVFRTWMRNNRHLYA